MESADRATPSLQDFIDDHRRVYLESGGAEGHILDLRSSAAAALGVHLLIRCKGRKTGKIRIAPLCYGIFAGEVAIVASKGGADEHPAWYRNLVASPSIDFQIATQAFRAQWREPEAEEYRRVWDYMVGCYSFYDDYRQRTSRRIPVVLMRPVEPIPVFAPSDLD